MSSIIEVRGVATGRSETFPYFGMRVLGSVQICIGVLVFILGVADLVLTLISYKNDLDKYGSRYGLVFTATGFLGTFMTRDRADSIQYFKACFLILNVLCCGLFAPVCAAIAGYTSYARHDLDKGNFQWLITLAICFLAVIEAAIATVSAAVTCCCSVRSAQIHVIVNPRCLIGQDDEPIEHRKCSIISRRSQVTPDDVVNNNNNNSNSNDNNNNNENIISNSSSKTRSNRNSIKSSPRKLQSTWSSKIQGNGYSPNIPANGYSPNIQANGYSPNIQANGYSPTIQASGYRPRHLPRIEVLEPINNGFGITSKYSEWNKWAVHSSYNNNNNNSRQS